MKLTLLSTCLTTALLFTGQAWSAENPFALSSDNEGLLQIAEQAPADKGNNEMKCGAGKCGAQMKPEEMKCGAGKCGTSQAPTQEEKPAEGQSTPAKCGAK